MTRIVPAVFVLTLLPFCRSPDSAGSDSADLQATRQTNLNDLSILYPFPDVASAELFLAPTSEGAHGQLFPQALFEQLPALSQDPATQAQAFDELRVVSARFDPCFTGFASGHGDACEAQVRLQLQLASLIQDEHPGELQLEAESAVHLIYAISTKDFSELVRMLIEARQKSGVDNSGPLDVNPIMKVQGLTGQYAQAVNALILRYAGADNLSRVAFVSPKMLPPSPGAVAKVAIDFGHFNVQSGALVPREIKTTGGATSMTQILDISFGANGMPVFVAHTEPAGTSADMQSMALVFDVNAIAAASTEAALSAFDATLRVDNPDRHALETLDCVTCHNATSGRTLLSTMQSLDVNMARPDRYLSSLDLTLNRTVTNQNDTNIMFGYKQRTPAGPRVSITQRVVNETAAAVQFLRSR